MNNIKNADITDYTSCCTASTKDLKNCDCEPYTEDEEETEYNNYIILLNSEKSKEAIDNANLDTLICWRKMLYWRSKFVKEASFNLIVERLKIMCPHKNCGEDTFETGYDKMENCKYCYDCKSIW